MAAWPIDDAPGQLPGSGSTNGTAHVWDASGQTLLEVRHNAKVNAVAYSPDGTKLATGSNDKTTRIWDAYNGHTLFEARANKGVATVAFSPDGTRLATGSKDQAVRIWPVPEW